MAITTPEETIMEERYELLVSPNHLNPTRKTARFLKPSSINGDFQKLFFSNHSSVPKNSSFKGWKNPQKDWKSWVDSMYSLHKSTWEKAGICNAVLNSSFEIPKNDNLILKFAEKWCHETNTFVFKWGETTITLEDMMVLGGFSVLGESVVSLPIDESKTILAKLNKARVELLKSTYRKVDQFLWMKNFKDSGSEIEHEAFLALWLSRFVFPSTTSTVVRSLSIIAVHLARGVKLALAPAVLATIYRDLSLLKAKIVNDDIDTTSVIVWAPFQLVILWIWERFPKFRPILEDSYTKLHKKNVGLIVDCRLQDFCWQPYGAKANDYLGFCNLYQEKGRWVAVDDCLDEEFESWARCLRVSEILGLDGSCIEQYLPHRVAMQFGMNQDIPSDVARANANPEIAWEFYTRPVKDMKMYFPSRDSEPYVTVRYMDWWNKSTGPFNLQSPIGDNETKKYAKDESRNRGSEESVAGLGSVDEVDTLGLELEARINKLEEVFAYLKARQ